MLSRRELFRASGALALSPLIARAERWVPAADSFSFSFFSDTHVGLKSNLAENRAMFTEMAGLPLDFGINGGDVTDYGWADEYKNYREILKLAPFPVHHIPGNHDVRWSPLGPKAYREGTGDPMYTSFDRKGVHFALLDSTIPLSHYGHFESEMLRWLETDLKRVGRETPVFVATHHWVGRDGIQVDNEQDLLRILEPYNVKIVLNAHGHSDLLWTWNGIPNTMNKGLYQLSYERIDVDRDKGEVRMSRRTKERPEQTLLLTVPLAAPREKRPVWAIPASLTPGAALAAPTGSREMRWDDGAWEPIPAEGIPTAGLVGGMHRLSLRTKKTDYLDAGRTEVAGSGGVLRKAWDRKLTGGVMSHLRLADGVLYVSAMDGSLTALRDHDGRPLWTAKTGGYCHSSPLVLRDLVVVGSADGKVHAFDRKSGRPRWSFETHGPVYASAAEAQGIVCVGSGDGLVYGLDAKSGERRWEFRIPPSQTSFVQSPAATDGERFFLGAWDKYLYALDAKTGEMAWRKDCVGERSFAYSPAIGGPAVGGGRVYVPANGNVLWAFDAKTGDEIWHVSSPGEKFGYSSPCLVGDRIFIGCLGDDKGEARCVSAKDGQILWTAVTGSSIYDSSPCHANGVVTIGSVRSLVSALSAEDGKILGQYRLPIGHILASPVADGRRVYIASLSDHVVAFDFVH